MLRVQADPAAFARSRGGKAHLAIGMRALVVTLTVYASAPPAIATADWLFTPFVGVAVAQETTFLVFDQGSHKRLTIGGSAALLSDGILGLEADIGHTPRFFQSDDPLGLVLASRVTTLTGSVIIAAPLTLTRESLRPYLVGGLGLMQARSRDLVGLLPLESDLLGLSFGGGAIGLLTERIGLRFELRHFRALSGEDGPFAQVKRSRLSFWRATTGVTIRY